MRALVCILCFDGIVVVDDVMLMLLSQVVLLLLIITIMLLFILSVRISCVHFGMLALMLIPSAMML